VRRSDHPRAEPLAALRDGRSVNVDRVRAGLVGDGERPFVVPGAEVERPARDGAFGLNGRRIGRELESERKFVSQTYLDVCSYLTPAVHLQRHIIRCGGVAAVTIAPLSGATSR
jgi:hypothetical protein